MFGFKRRRRERLRSKVTPASWLEIIERNVPYFKLLEDDEKKSLLGDVHIFLHEKKFEGCAGFEVTDEVRVTIATQACLLLLGRKTDFYPRLKSILVYPHPYRSNVTQVQPDGTIIESKQGRLGESWFRGSVVLAWDAINSGAVDIRDGHNVVIHEFAHQLDSETGAVQGTPRLMDRSAYANWARVMSREYKKLLAKVAANNRTVMDRYGATNAAEFFAVATETFFEKPFSLKKRHPELYATMAEFYQQDPIQRFRPR